MHPKYTFLLPAFKKQYLKEAIASVLNQTYADFRIVVSDDCSPDPLKNIVEQFNDPRISYRRNEYNYGADNLVKHWNSLLETCESEFVIIASDDDLYHPYFLQQLDILAQEHPDSDLLRSSAFIIDQDENILKEETNPSAYYTFSDFIGLLINPNSILCIGNFAFRLSKLKSIGGFIDFPLGWKSDSATELALGRHGVPNVPTPLFYFRISGLNISSYSEQDDEKNRKKLSALLEFHSWLTDHVEKDVLSRYDSSIKTRLEGESRSYYSGLSFREFSKLFVLFIRERWFQSFRNMISFILGWFK